VRRAANGPEGRIRKPNSRRTTTSFALGIIAVVFELISGAAHAAPILTSVVIRGSSVYSPPQLFTVYREELGKEISVESARAVVSALVARYETDGYAQPQIKVDDSLTGAGVLRLDVFEARIMAVNVSGDPGPHRERLEELGSRLRALGPVTPAAMQTALRHMRDLPGLRVSATTQADPSAPNTYALDLDTQFDPVSGAVRLSNRGTGEVGPEFVMGQFMVNGLFGGRTSLGSMFGAATDYGEYHGAGVLANVALGDAGSNLSFSAFNSRSNPHERGGDLDDLYVRDRLTIGGALPLQRKERSSLTLNLTLDLDDLNIARRGVELRDERLRMLDAGSTWTWQHGATAQSLASVDLVKGLNGLGSGLVAFDLVNDPRRRDFALSRATYVRLARLNDAWTLRLDALAQQSAYVLPDDQRFKIGGDRLGRGFEVAEIAGDSGAGAKVEGRRRLAAAPKALGQTSIYGYYDIAAVWKNDLPGRESAATAGVGFSLQTSHVAASFELAQPLTHPDVEGRTDLSLFAEVTVPF